MTTATHAHFVALPRRKRGRQTPAAELAFADNMRAFADALKQIASRLDFKVTSRGWCYLLEQHGQLLKGDFDVAQERINDCRKLGLLPVDFCLEDTKRAAVNVEDIHGRNVDAYTERLAAFVAGDIENYAPFSFWDDKDVYVQMYVEKLDLRPLFEPVCAKYRVPLANVGGWGDLNGRAEFMERFKRHEAAGRRCVLLYCGDHDPGGLLISASLRDNLAELSAAVGWAPDNLVIDRFGLNFDFIQAHKLKWIDNLETGGGGRLDDPKHKFHRMPYVQEYLRQFGARKVEANALVVIPDEARRLCERAILRWVKDSSAPERYEAQLVPWIELLRTTVNKRFMDGV